MRALIEALVESGSPPLKAGAEEAYETSGGTHYEITPFGKRGKWKASEFHKGRYEGPIGGLFDTADDAKKAVEAQRLSSGELSWRPVYAGKIKD